MCIGVARDGVDVTAKRITTVQCHGRAKSSLVGCNRPRPPLCAEIDRLLSTHTLKSGEQGALNIDLCLVEVPDISSHHPDQILSILITRCDPGSITLHSVWAVRDHLLHPTLITALKTGI